MWKKIKPYVISVLLALGVGGLSALITRNSMDIYEDIVKPSLSPPGFIFPIVWTILYTLMGLSAARVFVKSDGKIQSTGLGLYITQLIFNFAWPIAFFSFRAFLFSFVWLIALWLLVLFMIIRFYRVSKGAALLQIPYLVWLTFALYLNYMIYILN